MHFQCHLLKSDELCAKCEASAPNSLQCMTHVLFGSVL